MSYDLLAFVVVAVVSFSPIQMESESLLKTKEVLLAIGGNTRGLEAIYQRSEGDSTSTTPLRILPVTKNVSSGR